MVEACYRPGRDVPGGACGRGRIFSCAHGERGCEATNAELDGCTGYRLPTEAEWEYASRAGSDARDWWGADPAVRPSVAWVFENSGDRPHPVDSVPDPDGPAHPWGLLGMYGNIYELTHDGYGPYFGSPSRDPMGADGVLDVVRRGGAYGGGSAANSAARDIVERNFRVASFGFRLVRPLTAGPPARPEVLSVDFEAPELGEVPEPVVRPDAPIDVLITAIDPQDLPLTGGVYALGAFRTAATHVADIAF